VDVGRERRSLTGLEGRRPEREREQEHEHEPELAHPEPAPAENGRRQEQHEGDALSDDLGPNVAVAAEDELEGHEKAT
jgi:hypothetical protein